MRITPEPFCRVTVTPVRLHRHHHSADGDERASFARHMGRHAATSEHHHGYRHRSGHRPDEPRTVAGLAAAHQSRYTAHRHRIRSVFNTRFRYLLIRSEFPNFNCTHYLCCSLRYVERFWPSLQDIPL